MKKQFLLTFTGPHANWNKKTDAEWKSLNQKHQQWFDKFKDGCKSAAKLASKPSKILTENNVAPKVMDGPFSETKEVLTGFYLIEAEDMNHAVELAKGCPWLLHDKMEIFEVEQ